MVLTDFALPANLLGAVIAMVAAWYWLKSTATKLPEIDRETGKPVGPIDMLTLYVTVTESAQANKTAAILTGISTILFALGTAGGAMNG